jgi:hypothetical protein
MNVGVMIETNTPRLPYSITPFAYTLNTRGILRRELKC